MIVTNEKIEVTLEMLEHAGMFRSPNECGVPVDADDTQGLEWVSFDDLTEAHYDRLESYFLKNRGYYSQGIPNQPEHEREPSQRLMKTTPDTGDTRFPLWNHLAEQHGLILTESEVDEIVKLTAEISPSPKLDPNRIECSDAMANLLTELRNSQKGFFRTKKSEFLQESKRLEREVDAFLQKRKAQKSPDAFDLFS